MDGTTCQIVLFFKWSLGATVADAEPPIRLRTSKIAQKPRSSLARRYGPASPKSTSPPNFPINGDAYLFVQQVVPAYEDGIVDVSVWIDNVPDAINWQCNLYISQEWG